MKSTVRIGKTGGISLPMRIKPLDLMAGNRLTIGAAIAAAAMFLL
jgi:hypothetical protein